MKFNRGKISKRQKVLFIVPLLFLTYALVFFAGAAYAVAPTAAWILNNNLSIQWKDSGGTARNIIYADASNQWNLCPAVASATCTTGDTAGNILVGNGLVLTTIADAAKAGLLFLSSTTAKTLKYYDASSGLHAIATLDLAQTFTGVQTFAASGIILKGAGAGTGTFTYANSGSSGTLTFPAVTDTVAVLGQVQTFTAALTISKSGGNQLTIIDTSQTNPAGNYDVSTAFDQFRIDRGGSLIWNLDSTGKIVTVNGATSQGPISFNAASTPGAGVAGIGASANAGNLLLNAPTGQSVLLTINGATVGTLNVNGLSGTNLVGTYNIGGTPSFTASPALSSGTTLPSGGLMMFSMINSGGGLDTASTVYCPPVGYIDSATGLGTVCTTTESNAKMTLPIKGVVKNLYVTLSAAPGASKSYAFTVRDNAANTILTCTVSGAATTCSDTSDTATVTKGDDIDISSAPSGTPTSAAPRISFEVDQSG